MMRSEFELENGIHYLNCAYMSPMKKSIRDAGYQAIDRKAKPYEIGVADFFEPVEEVRKLFARVIHAGDPERIAIVPSVSYGMANVANNLTFKQGEKVVLLEGQFPSNVYPWTELLRHTDDLMVVQKPKSGNISASWTERVLDKIGRKTKLVALPQVHWACGTMLDLAAVGRRCRETDTLFVVDGTQSIGAMNFDQGEIRADAVVSAGYKWLMGPYGIGAAYYGPWFDDKMPVEQNWINRLNSEDFTGLVNYQDQLRPKGARFSVGEQSNFILIAMFKKALEEVTRWGPGRIQSHCQKISAPAVGALRSAGLSVPPAGQTGRHLFGIRLGRVIDTETLKAVLMQHRVYVSFRGKQIRVSPHLYNNEEDFDVLKDLLVNL